MADTSKIAVAFVSALMRGFAILREFALWALGDVRPAIEPPRMTAPRRLSLAEQWTRLSDIVMVAASRAEEARRCHASATQQLDLAQYALTSLIDELSFVMDMGDRRRRATVHVLGVAPSSRQLPVGEAIAA